MGMEERTRWTRQWPRRTSFGLASVALVCVALAGFGLLRALEAGVTPSAAWMIADLQAQSSSYVYLATALLASLSVLGLVVGRKERLLLHASMTDPSTGLANRRPFQSALCEAVRTAARRSTPVSLLLIDLDGLKTINDVLGHSAGDAALKLVAESVRATCRATDLAARWGGDEFVVLARGTHAAGGVELGERIRATLHRLLAQDDYAALPAVTVSIGVADVERAGAPRPEALFFASDRALYTAKSRGKDRVVMACQEPHAAAARFRSPTLPIVQREAVEAAARAVLDSPAAPPVLPPLDRMRRMA